jgi:hypothetical protein
MRVVIVFLFLISSYLNAQKIVQKTIVNPHDTSLQIDANNCFEVEIETVKTDKIVVEAKMSGEYSDNLSLNIHEEGNTLLVETSFNANFEIPNDKLSAHKVISIALKISLPEYLKVSIYGTDTNVTVKGIYKNINIALNDGRCVLNGVENKAFVKTHSGTIEVNAKTGKFDVLSKYGEVFFDQIPESHVQYNLNTTTGNIYIHKIN